MVTRPDEPLKRAGTSLLAEQFQILNYQTSTSAISLLRFLAGWRYNPWANAAPMSSLLVAPQNAMALQDSIINRDGMYSFMLRSCTSGILANIVDPAVPIVWVRRHTPKSYVQWWQTRVPLSESGEFHDVELRSLEFDLQLSTSHFLALLPEFENHGIVLLQMTRRVPDTLTLDGLADASANRVLIQNGLHLHFYLPHALESAQLSSPHREVLENALQRREVRELAY